MHAAITANKRRRGAFISASSFAVLLSAPIFYGVFSMLNVDPPPRAALFAGGTWEGEDDAGERLRLRVNRFGVAALELPGVHHKGPVEFGEGSLTVKPIPLPLLASLGSTTTLRVDKWPTEEARDECVLDGVRFTRR